MQAVLFEYVTGHVNESTRHFHESFHISMDRGISVNSLNVSDAQPVHCECGTKYFHELITLSLIHVQKHVNVFPRPFNLVQAVLSEYGTGHVNEFAKHFH